MGNEKGFKCKLRLGLVVGLALTACFPCQEAWAARPATVRAATYASDDWVTNFWNSESTHMDEELARIASDGFNSIILVVPWREFQPDINPASYEPYAWEKLEKVMEAAGRQDLGVLLRVGYTWDYAANSSVLSRYESLLYSSHTREAWKAYLERIYQLVSRYPNFYGAFLTWEDFWNFTETAGGMGQGRNSAAMAKTIGYQKYLDEHYSLEQVQNLYGQEFADIAEVYLPQTGKKAFRLFYEFYDEWLLELLQESQTVFPDLSIEIRLDEDIVGQGEGSPEPVSHTSLYSCGSASYAAAMYSVAMGHDTGTVISAAQALNEMSGTLSRAMVYTGGKSLFLDQFLYMDNTPGFENSARLAKEQRTQFLLSAAPVLRAKTMGYGVWAYRDYGNNMVYNSQFALGERGWNCSGGASVVTENGNRRLKFLSGGGSVSQQIGNRDATSGNRDTYVRFRAGSEDGGTLVVTLGGVSKSIQVKDEETYVLQFGKLTYSGISFGATKELWFDDVSVYNHVQEGGLYDLDNQPLECLEAMRNLNLQMR